MNNYILGVKSVKEQNEETPVQENGNVVETPVVEQKEETVTPEVINVVETPVVEPIVEEIKDNEPLFSTAEREELNDNMIEETVVEEKPIVETKVEIPVPEVVNVVEPAVEKKEEIVTAPIVEEKPSVVEQREAIAPISSNNYNTIERDFVDEKEEEATLIISPTNASNLNMGMSNYKLAESMKPKAKTRSLFKKGPSRGVLRSDIGIKSGGFAGIASIGALVAFGALIIMYLAFRF